MKNAIKIIDRIKEAYKMRSDTELADYLGIPQSTLAAQKSRNSLNIELIIEKCNDLNPNWILLGEGPVLKSTGNRMSNSELIVANTLVDQLEQRAAELTRRVQNLDIDPQTKLEMIGVMIEALEIGLKKKEKDLASGPDDD